MAGLSRQHRPCFVYIGVRQTPIGDPQYGLLTAGLSNDQVENLLMQTDGVATERHYLPDQGHVPRVCGTTGSVHTGDARLISLLERLVAGIVQTHDDVPPDLLGRHPRGRGGVERTRALRTGPDEDQQATDCQHHDHGEHGHDGPDPPWAGEGGCRLTTGGGTTQGGRTRGVRTRSHSTQDGRTWGGRTGGGVGGARRPDRTRRRAGGRLWPRAALGGLGVGVVDSGWRWGQWRWGQRRQRQWGDGVVDETNR